MHAVSYDNGMSYNTVRLRGADRTVYLTYRAPCSLPVQLAV